MASMVSNTLSNRVLTANTNDNSTGQKSLRLSRDYKSTQNMNKQSFDINKAINSHQNNEIRTLVGWLIPNHNRVQSSSINQSHKSHRDVTSAEPFTNTKVKTLILHQRAGSALVNRNRPSSAQAFATLCHKKKKEPSY